jgi:dTDP-4-dehydrorhamnose 3,5-epimerase
MPAAETDPAGAGSETGFTDNNRQAHVMSWEKLDIDGVYLFHPKVFEDERGVFVKTFAREFLTEPDVTFALHEEFYSVSVKHVIRGMHFQLPPFAQNKMVYCLHGRVLDVLLDLRRKSPTRGRHLALELSDDPCSVLWIPPGVAHGFQALSHRTILVYKTDQPYSPEHDRGIRYDSFGYHWPCKAPVISERDLGFPPLDEFETVF